MYKLQGNSIKRLSDGANIPLADGNMDYEEYKQWLAEGNIPEPMDLPTPEEILQGYIAIKDQVVADKLKALRYDSLATVKLWADDVDFGAEATRILEWYKNVTKASIQLENDVLAGTVPMPTEEEYKIMLEGVAF